MARRSYFFIAAMLVALTFTGCAGFTQFYWQRKMNATFPSSRETGHVIMHWRPGSAAEHHVNRIAAAAEREIAQICARLAVANDTIYDVYVFDDADELARQTGIKGVGGFASGRSVFITCRNEPARLHELVHAVHNAKISSGGNTFTSEGLGNAFFDDVPGWDVHAVARYYLRQKKLPGLPGMLADFHAQWRKNPGFNVYDVAGSWMRFLIDTHGIEATKRYLTGEDPSIAFQASVSELEQAWHAMLERYQPPLAIARQVAWTEGNSPESVTRFAGESLAAAIDFSLQAEPDRKANGTVLEYTYRFMIDPTKSPTPVDSEWVRYQWWKDGQRIAGETGPVLHRSHLQPEDSGVYMAVVSLQDGTRRRPIIARVIGLSVVPAVSD